MSDPVRCDDCNSNVTGERVLCVGCADAQAQSRVAVWEEKYAALSRARETDGASSTLVPERPGDSPSRCGLAFGQCRYQRRAAAESCALLSTPTPGLDMTQVLFPGSRPKPKPKPKPQTEDGAVREAAERLAGVLRARQERSRCGDLACDAVRHEAQHLLSALSPTPRPATEDDAANCPPYPWTWERVARRVGEEFARGGPDGYYDFGPAEWQDWMLARIYAMQPPADAATEAVRTRLCACAWCGAALVQDPDAPHRWRCINAEQRKCVARGDWYILADDRDYVPAYPAPAPSAKEGRA